jgi:site-specific DNA-methyltransferase (adenine-specific)
MDYTLHHGDCLEVMATMADNSVDAIVTDPPYGLSFMGKNWDHGVPGEEFWREALRIAKPGAHLLAFGGTRTFHRLAVAIEDAGWEMRDTIGMPHESGDRGDCPWLLAWVYGSGFPKSLDVSKAIDKAAGAERAVLSSFTRSGKSGGILGQDVEVTRAITAPATDAARQWSGWGTALKPAWEPITMARKPLACCTVAANVLQHGTGALNVDGCRVGVESTKRTCNGVGQSSSFDMAASGEHRVNGSDSGRWPANLIHDGSDEVVGLFPQTTSGSGNKSHPESNRYGGNALHRTSTLGDGNGGNKTSPLGRWPANLIHDGSDEVVGLFPQTVGKIGMVGNTGGNNRIYGKLGRQEDRQPGTTDTGSAARFFYCAKASAKDRDEGVAGVAGGMSGRRDGSMGSITMRKNTHPTVKPTDLMRYLCRLVTPPGGIVLDPFMGSGSTGKAAILEGFQFIGIERDAEYLAIAEARISHASGLSQPPQRPTRQPAPACPGQLALF